MTWLWVVIAVVVIAVIVAAAVVMLRKRRRTKQLQSGFGPEYKRELANRGSRKEAEDALEARRERREQLDIRPLDPKASEEFGGRWRDVQRRFVDEPSQALAQAQELVVEVMRTRGYPMDSFE